MNHRLRAIRDGVGSILSACAPRLKPYRVSYFNSKDKWTETEVMAYTRQDAADKLSWEGGSGKNLKPGYNCWAVRVFKRR